MTKECFYCGFKEPMPFTCKFCSGSYCYSHRLPESHNCSGLSAYKERVNETGILYKPDNVIRKRPNPIIRNLKHIASVITVSYTHLRAHETKANLVCRLLLEKKK